MAEHKEKAVQAEEEQDLSEILRIRREKLAKMQANGENPYFLTSFDVKQKLSLIHI